MKLFIGSDHAGYKLKEELKDYIKELGYEVVDKGPFSYNEEDDYPDFILPVAKEVAKNPREHKGIVIGGSGQGESIAANKVKGIRAALYYGYNLDIVKLSRQHNDANILSLGARFLNLKEAQKAVKIWLETPFSHEQRHVRRIKKIEEGV